MEEIINYSNYKLNEATVEIEDSEEGVYVLTLQDIKNIISSFTDQGIDDDIIIAELSNYKFVKVEDVEITKIDEPTEEIEELSSDDENPTFIKKFEEL